MFDALIGPVISALGGNLLDKIEGAFKDYLAEKITREQLQEKLQEALLASLTEIEKSYADSIARSYVAFMQAAQTSVIMQRAWALVVVTQLFVLIWYQWIAPVTEAMHWIVKWGTPSVPIEWAYLLIVFCLGGGAVIARSGPAAAHIDDLKALIAK